jgi:YgiT-type zinc finger domain-containing protein
MICVICRQAEIIDGFTSIHFQRGEMHLTIKSVPARVCPSCGETYVDEGVAVQLLQRAEELYEEGSSEFYAEYKTG